jgi:hypothetical protein
MPNLAALLQLAADSGGRSEDDAPPLAFFFQFLSNLLIVLSADNRAAEGDGGRVQGDGLMPIVCE